MRPWPLLFCNAGDKSLLEALIMKLNGIIHRRLLRSQAQYPLFPRGSEVRLANDLLLLNARGLLSRKVANIRCQRTDTTGRERKKNAPAQATIQNARNSYNGRFVITGKERSDPQELLDIAQSFDQIEARKFPSLGKKGMKYIGMKYKGMKYAICNIPYIISV